MNTRSGLQSCATSSTQAIRCLMSGSVFHFGHGFRIQRYEWPLASFFEQGTASTSSIALAVRKSIRRQKAWPTKRSAQCPEDKAILSLFRDRFQVPSLRPPKQAKSVHRAVRRLSSSSQQAMCQRSQCIVTDDRLASNCRCLPGRLASGPLQPAVPPRLRWHPGASAFPLR